MVNLRSRFLDQVFYEKAIQKHRIVKLTGRRPMQALVDGISDNDNYADAFKYDNDAVTNRYGLPLVEVVGLTNSNKTSFLCDAFMASESASDYVWFLEQLKSKCFTSNESPKIIATDREIAHINKSIKVKISKYFPDISAERRDETLKVWSSTVSSSSTEVDFESSFSEFSMQFASGEAGIRFIDYIKDNWVENHKKTWTDDHMHFNSTLSSKIEGVHSMLKRYIKSSTGHIDTVFERIHNAITNQLQQIDVQRTCLTITQSNFWRNISMFNKFRGEELQAYQEELTVRHEADMEIYHKAQERAQLNENVLHIRAMLPYKNLMVKDFLDELCRNDVIQNMQSPAIQQPRDARNRIASRNVSSTPINPFSFEYAEGRSSATRCGVCSGAGHNRRRCP
ncbi:hypothetical protein G6F56_009091 [Rhizopus delemar]|nr:hypothetical protein G6F56_009091 [Rhizopus delemar]